MAEQIDTKELRRAFGSFVTGVTVMTTVDQDGTYQGVTANSFSSVSLDPPLVLWSQATNARSFAAFRDVDHFVVNILAEHQQDLSQRFATQGIDKFDGIRFHLRLGAIPVLEECCAYIECKKVAIYPGGDHVVYLGKVLRVEYIERRPLVFSRGKYMRASEHEVSASLRGGLPPHVAHNRAIRLGSSVIAGLAKELGVTAGLGVWGNRGATIIRWESYFRGAGSSDAAVHSHHIRTGMVVSPIHSATGLLFTSLLPKDVTAEALDEAFSEVGRDGEAMAWAARKAYEQKVAQVRRDGYAMSRPQNLASTIGLSAPVFDRDGNVVLALSVLHTESTDESANERTRRNVLAAAERLSVSLGHQRANSITEHVAH